MMTFSIKWHRKSSVFFTAGVIKPVSPETFSSLFQKAA
jgi:hypothetical protein